MDTDACWPQWMDGHRLGEAALAEAYDMTPAPYRACIKNGMAFLHALWGEQPEAADHKITDSARGFRYAVRERPVPWALAALGPGYAAPSRLAAALMPALLARVPLLGVVCLEPEAALPSPAARVALELAGVEDIFLSSLPVMDDLLCHMARIHGRGRLVLLHQGELESLRCTAAGMGLPVWEESRPPRLLLDAAPGPAMPPASGALHAPGDTAPPASGTASGPDRDLLAFCQPDALLEEMPGVTKKMSGMSGNAAMSPPCDAVYSDAPVHALAYGAPLTLRSGMEGCWLHTGLDTTFFRQRGLCAGPYPPLSGEDA